MDVQERLSASWSSLFSQLYYDFVMIIPFLYNENRRGNELVYDMLENVKIAGLYEEGAKRTSLMKAIYPWLLIGNVR
jgi:hypothetical protein